MVVQLPQDNQNVVILFRLPAQIWADHIQLVGDFNNWSTSATAMQLGEQYWEARLTLHVGERYHYAYLVDGDHWCSDWSLKEIALNADPPPVTMIPIDGAEAWHNVAAS
jgi:1,4-alpha-glucan branching enzyme